MTYTIRYSGRFKKSYKLCKRRGLDMSHLSMWFVCLQKQVLCQPSIVHIFLPENMQEFGNVI